jgi:hypothetical protein
LPNIIIKVDSWLPTKAVQVQSQVQSSEEQNVGADDRTNVDIDYDHMMLRAVTTIYWYNECLEHVETRPKELTSITGPMGPVISRGPNGVGVSLPSPEDGNRYSF